MSTHVAMTILEKESGKQFHPEVVRAMKDYIYAAGNPPCTSKPRNHRMIIAVFIVLSIPVGYLMGGKLKNIKNYQTRALGLSIAAFLLEAAAPFLRNLISVPIADWHWMIVVAEYLLLFAFCALNIKSKAVWIILLACALNFFVIALFGFQMPVAPYAGNFPGNGRRNRQN